MAVAVHDDARVMFNDLRARGLLKRYEAAELCAANPNNFAEHCFGVEQQPLHERWHDAMRRHRRNLFWCPPEHGKTWQLGFVRMIWELGRDVQRSFAHFSGTADIPDANLEQVAKHIHKNDKVHQVFPHLRVANFKRTKGGTLALWVERPNEHTDRDPSIRAAGILGQIMGWRLDGILMDDVLDFDNTYTRGQRQKLKDRLENEILTRENAEAWMAYIGHPWFRDDAGHWLAAKSGWQSYRYDAECDIDGKPGPPGLWPRAFRDETTGRLSGWPWERLMERKANTDAITWERVWRCRTPSTQQEQFPLGLLLRARERGRGWEMPRPAPEGTVPVSGIDPSTGDGRDLSTIVTVCVQAGQLQVLDVRGGLWDDGRLYREMRTVLRAFPRHAGFLFEDIAFQRLYVRTLKRREVMRSYGWTDDDMDRCRVVGFTTSKKKHDTATGIRSMAVDFQQDRVTFPEGQGPEQRHSVQQLIDGLNDYDPDLPEVHTSDWVMGFWLAYEMQRRLGRGARHLGIT